MTSVATEPETPAGYVHLSAEGKAAWIWKSLICSGIYAPSDIPTLRMPFQQSMRKEISTVTRRSELEKALTRTEDVMEPGRPKVIHALGSAAMVRLVPSKDSPFTGLIGPPSRGGAIGTLRMSLVATTLRSRAYIPGFGLKFLIDGCRSADILAMNHTIGQGRDFNVFSNTMTNDLTEEHHEIDLEQRIMERLFKRVSHNPRRLASSHLTALGSDGSPVDSPSTPIRLIFHPTQEAANQFQGQAGVDFRLVLSGIPEDTPLYRVTGLTAEGQQTIGTIETTSRFVASSGAERLYFRHVQHHEDRKT